MFEEIVAARRAPCDEKSSRLLPEEVDPAEEDVSGPLEDRCGPSARTLTVELHGAEVRGLAISPGRVFRYVFDSRRKRFRTVDVLKLTKATRKPAA